MTPWQNRITRYGSEAPDQLLANPRNWRTHPATQTDALAGVLGEVGVVQNVIVNERTGFVVDGHARIALALRTGQPSIPVTYVDLSEDEEAVILATLDPLAAMAGTDAAKLDDLLRDVTTGDAATQAMLDDLATAAGIVPGVEAGQGGDEFDTTPDDGPTRTALGDLWLIGGVHRLLVGDCTIAANVTRLMGGARAGAVFLDPPYGIRLDTEYSGITLSPKAREKHPVQRDYAPVIGDDKDYDPQPLIAMFKDVKEQYWWGADYYRKSLPDGGSWLVWDKRQGVEDVTFDTAAFELCWSKAAHRREIIRARWMGLIGMETQDTATRVHPTQKPLEVYLWLFEHRTVVNALIFDGYLGSGTTLIAAHRTGRRCYGMEIAPRYADVILRRAEAEGLSVERLSP